MISRERSPVYWAIAPFNNIDPDMVKRTWFYDSHYDVIAVGWDKVGAIANLDKNQLQRAMRESYRDQPGAWKSLWAFYHDIQKDDYIVARTGRSTILGLGQVTGDAYFDEKRGRTRVGGQHAWYKPHFRDVHWLQTERIHFGHYVFSIPTVTRIGKHLPEIRRRLENVGG